MSSYFREFKPAAQSFPQDYFELLILGFSEAGIIINNIIRESAGQGYQTTVRNPRHAELGDSMLARAKDFARPAKLQVGLGDFESVGSRGDNIDPLLSILRASLTR